LSKFKKIDLALANQAIFKEIFVVNYELNHAVLFKDVKFEYLLILPIWRITRMLKHPGFYLLFVMMKNNEVIHLSEK